MSPHIMSWNIRKSDELYNISGWGNPYFSVNRKGEIAVHPKGLPRKSFSLKTLVDQIGERGIQTPFLLRFNDIITHRLTCIGEAFESAIKEFNYTGKHAIIYPIKVNQQKHVVDQITKFCDKKSSGLEAGSKPELLSVLALSQKDTTPIVCNGYKDSEYFEICLMGTKIGKPVYPVIEKFSEFETLINTAKKLKLKPTFGVRIKLSTYGSGRWQASSGHRSKFGLSVTELIKGVALLKSKKMLSGFKLLHFHQGSQITDIGTLKKSLKEATRIYAELIKIGVPLEIIDVGGGLGVDYNGSNTAQDSSTNYTLQEYANDIVFQIKEMCDSLKIKHPTIFTECGRAVVAYHAVLIFNILGISGYDRFKVPANIDTPAPLPLKELLDIRKALSRGDASVMEHYHDVISNYHECQNLFGLGYLSIHDLSLAEELYFSSLKRIQSIIEKEEDLPDEIKLLQESLSDIYFGNFSVFQSLPDHWAIDQQFPITPIHRLKEEPTRNAIIADITCDSDGKIDTFIDPNEKRKTLKLHPHHVADDYYLGVFLVGAYQETLGDLHNLFGDTTAVHVSMDHKNRPLVEYVVKGDTVKEVLSYVQYDVDDLVDMMHSQIERAVRTNLIDYKESGNFIKFYETAIEGYTYLEDWEAKEEF
ncbi:MAG: biosynthetic arginine decarboxylase [Deltaproteobacteria bacterium]|nr:biosynthetic arginine decarboxylase [Deltaproteobacteria bacterium]